MTAHCPLINQRFKEKASEFLAQKQSPLFEDKNLIIKLRRKTRMTTEGKDDHTTWAYMSRKSIEVV